MDTMSSSRTDVLGAWHHPALESPHSTRWVPLPSETAWAHTRASWLWAATRSCLHSPGGCLLLPTTPCANSPHPQITSGCPEQGLRSCPTGRSARLPHALSQAGGGWCSRPSGGSPALCAGLWQGRWSLVLLAGLSRQGPQPTKQAGPWASVATVPRPAVPSGASALGETGEGRGAPSLSSLVPGVQLCNLEQGRGRKCLPATPLASGLCGRSQQLATPMGRGVLYTKLEGRGGGLPRLYCALF